MAEVLSKKQNFTRGKVKDLIFYCAWLFIPLAQFCVFYIAVNFNTIALSFQQYGMTEQGIPGYSFAGFDTYAEVFKDLFTNYKYTRPLVNSLKAWLVSACVFTPLTFIFAYYIFKGFAGNHFFKVVLFLPSVISAMVFSFIFRNFVDDALPKFFADYLGVEIPSLLFEERTRFFTLNFYKIFGGFSGILLYINAMNEVNVSAMESGKLDGTNAFTELIHIILPGTWKVFVSMFVMGLGAIFTNDLSITAFYSWNSPSFNTETIGYTMTAEINLFGDSVYPFYAAMGIILTFISAPVVLIVRWAMNKYGPRED